MTYEVDDHRLVVDGKKVDFVKSPNIGGAMKPQFLIIHYTASGPGSDIAKYFSSSAAKVSAHLVVRRDGTIKQCVPFNVTGWHAGKSSWTDLTGKSHIGLNTSSIGIEIENWGPLTETGSGWASWTGAAVGAGVIKAAHKFGGPVRGWEMYTDDQIASVIGASQAICAKYGIEEILGHEDISPGRKSDPGPAWKMDSFVAKVKGRESDEPDYWIVRSPTGLNLRDAPSAAGTLIESLPDGAKVSLLEASGNWRYVSVLNSKDEPRISGWVHGGYLRDI